MRFLRKHAPYLFLLVMCGCATMPTGPSVNVMPAQGKPFDTFRAEDATCRQWAQQAVGRSAEETYNSNVATGAVAGTAVGAGLGAAVGSASGHAGAGALIGAASGLLVGTAAGSGSGQAYGREAQRRYDNAYVQCMYSYGNQVPGRPRVVVASAAPVAAVPPPPPPVMAQADVPPPPPEMAPDQGQAPPDLYLNEAPQFIYSPDLGMYVAVGVPYDLVYTGNEYFYFYGGRWFHGPYYNGPWAFAPRRLYPPVFLRFRIGDVRHFRDQEFRRYEHDRGHYGGRFHRPAFRGRVEHR